MHSATICNLCNVAVVFTLLYQLEFRSIPGVRSSQAKLKAASPSHRPLGKLPDKWDLHTRQATRKRNASVS